MESSHKFVDIEKLIYENNHKVSKNLERWQKLQFLIKEEITLNEKIKSQRKIDVKNLKENFFNYFKNKLKIKETHDLYNHVINKNIDKMPEIKLCENRDDLGDCDLSIINLIKLMRNNYKHVLTIINLLEEEDKDEIADYIGHFLYENILILDPEHEELLNLCYLLLEKEINELETPNINEFLENSFIGRLFKNLCKRSDVKNYLSLTLKDLIMKLENLSENFMEIDLDKIYDYLRTSVNEEALFTNYFLEKTKNIIEKGKMDELKNKEIFFRKSEKNEDQLLNRSKVDMSYLFNKRTSFFDVKTSNKSNSFIVKNNNNEVLKQDLLINSKNSSDKKNDSMYFIQEELKESYLMNLTDDEIIKKYQDEKDEEMKEYYLCLLNKFSSHSKDIFTNKKLLDSISQYGSEDYKVLFIFKKNFEQIKFFLDGFLNSIIENSSLIPYIIKCICKMIYILISKKFANLPLLEKNSFIGKFIFGKIIMPILCNPDYNGIIYSHIISTNTRNNLKNINKILSKISRSNLFESYKNFNFTVFNNYLIEILPVIYNLYKSLIKVKLPDKIENFLKSNVTDTTGLENNDKDFFNIFPDQIYYFQCVCISIPQVNIIIKTIQKAKEKLTNSHPLFINAKSLFDKINFLKKINEKNIKYYLYFNKLKNPKKISEIFLKDEKMTFSQNDNIEHNFIISRIKYCIKIIFKSLNLINPRVHSFLEEADTTEKLIIGLNKIIELEDFNESENRIPLTWYSFYLQNYISKLNESYKGENYSLLYEELLNDVLKYIEKLKNINNVLNSKLGMNLRCAEKINEYTYKDYLKLKSIENFIRIDKFMETTNIEVCIRKTTKEEKIKNSELASLQVSKLENCYHQKLNNISRFIDGKAEKRPLIKKLINLVQPLSSNFANSSFNGSVISNWDKPSNKMAIYDMEGHCMNILEFVRNFQNYREIVEDIFFGENRNNVAKTMEEYMHIVFEYIDKDKIFSIYDEERKKIVLDDIENYIFRKMYKRVFPDKSLDDDKSFFEKCEMYYWVAPEHLLIKEKMRNEIIWEQGIVILKNIENEKSPIDKLNCIRSVEYLILNSINFCLCESDKIAGADDLYPIFAYLVLKAKPKRFVSNINYINTFLYGEKKTNIFGQLFFKMIFARTLIEKMKRDFFCNMPDEEYDEKMKLFELSRARSNSKVIRKGAVKKLDE